MPTNFDVARAPWRLRSWMAAAAAALLLAGCGGGSADGPGQQQILAPANPGIQGAWQLAVTANDVGIAPVAVAAGNVPSAEDVNALDANAVAQIVGSTLFQGYSVSVSGNTVRVTDPDTNYVLVVNSFTTSNYQGCGACGVGSIVSYTLSVGFGESGVIDARNVPATTGTLVLRLRYTRTA